MLAAIVLWGVIALRLAAPIVLLQLGTNVAGVVFIVASLRPPAWRLASLGTGK